MNLQITLRGKTEFINNRLKNKCDSSRIVRKELPNLKIKLRAILPLTS